MQDKLDLYANKILEDYDTNNPSSIFKTKIKLSNKVTSSKFRNVEAKFN